MNTKSLLHAAACCIAAGLLAGCTPPVRVKQVLSDPTTYLTAHFAPANLPQPVHDVITNADNGPLGFHKIVLHLDWALLDNDKAKTVHEKQTVTLLDAGGSFVQAITAYSRNGIPTNDYFDLSYRGLLFLKDQLVLTGATNATTAIRIHRITQFTAIGTSGAPLTYAFTAGFAPQIAGFVHGRDVCTQGQPYPASKVFATLQGQARDITCQHFNNNGVSTGTRGYAYLQHYGVAVYMHAKLASGDSDGKVTSVSVQ